MTTMSPTVRNATTVGDVLATVHETWMEQVATNLAPALSDEADFWSRWAVVRFLSDQFGDRFHLECALLDELDPLLPVQVTGTLASARAGLEHTMADLKSDVVTRFQQGGRCHLDGRANRQVRVGSDLEPHQRRLQ